MCGFFRGAERYPRLRRIKIEDIKILREKIKEEEEDEGSAQDH